VMTHDFLKNSLVMLRGIESEVARVLLRDRSLRLGRNNLTGEVPSNVSALSALR
jgi:hypothetical protein